jgi:hypothetical protein
MNIDDKTAGEHEHPYEVVGTREQERESISQATEARKASKPTARRRLSLSSFVARSE